MQPIPSDTSSASVPPLDIKWIPHQPPALFPSLKNHAAIICDNTMLIFGGFDGKSEKNTMITYDLYTNSLSIVNSAIKPRNGHSATFVPPQSMFIIGGWLNLGPYASDEIFGFRAGRSDFSSKRLSSGQRFGKKRHPLPFISCQEFQKAGEHRRNSVSCRGHAFRSFPHFVSNGIPDYRARGVSGSCGELGQFSFRE